MEHCLLGCWFFCLFLYLCFPNPNIVQFLLKFNIFFQQTAGKKTFHSHSRIDFPSSITRKSSLIHFSEVRAFLCTLFWLFRYFCEIFSRILQYFLFFFRNYSLFPSQSHFYFCVSPRSQRCDLKTQHFFLTQNKTNRKIQINKKKIK